MLIDATEMGHFGMGFVLEASLILPVIFLFAIPFIEGQSIEEEFTNPCVSIRTCSECIQASPLCAWCEAEVHSRDHPRCDKPDNLKRTCVDLKIIRPKSSFAVTRDDTWRSGDAKQAPVQIRPQEVKFVLGPNEPMSFKLMFQQQENYPVDLYFLLDLSYGMFRESSAQKRLIALGNDIPYSLKNITNNFRLGFGTFVDKLLMPYTAWTDEMLQDRCPMNDKSCVHPHDFKNQLSIGLNQSRFGQTMSNALKSVSQSLDDAEGGMDGLIQALDCDMIGWRKVSRRILVYSSNSLFHLAGAGKLGGATKHNTLKCSLNENGAYTVDKIYDYPSVSQIAQKIRDKKANVIFAVMKSVSEYYKTLENFLDGSVVGELEDDSKNIVSLIKEKYYELKSRIEFQPSQSANIDVKFSSKCKSNVTRETSVCENLEIMDSVEFNVTITVNKDICSGKTGSITENVVLNAIGLSEPVVVKLNIHCGCKCETTSGEPSTVGKCTSGNGTLDCGICRCNPGRFGSQCECDEKEISRFESFEKCKADNNSRICSGNGECICGECICFPVSEDSTVAFTGAYCECNNYNCPLDPNKLLCGGPSRGSCVCGACHCLSGWSGDRCQCSENTDLCLAANGDLCNGAGECQCGKCVCNSTSGMLGPTCEDCLTCPSQCTEYVDCAQCKGFQSGPYGSEECETNCKNYNVRIRDSLNSEAKGVRNCQGTDVDGCTLFFTYEYDANNDVILTIQETKACPKKLPLAAIIGGTISGVFLIPLLLIIIFLILRNLKDRKEYAKFTMEQNNAQWDKGANPIYREPTTTFTNFSYQGDRLGHTEDAGESSGQVAVKEN